MNAPETGTAVPLETAWNARSNAIFCVSEAVQHLNQMIRDAVDAGLSVELALDNRHHDGYGNWGDQVSPVYRSIEQPLQ